MGGGAHVDLCEPKFVGCRSRHAWEAGCCDLLLAFSVSTIVSRCTLRVLCTEVLCATEFILGSPQDVYIWHVWDLALDGTPPDLAVNAHYICILPQRE